MSDRYPNLTRLGVPVHPTETGGLTYVDANELKAALGARYDQYVRLQRPRTACVEGSYAGDVEEVLGRMGIPKTRAG